MKFLQIALVCGFVALLLLQRSVAEEFVVGGRAGWRPTSDYAQWSARNALQAGDSLVFPYDQGVQSVMRVSREDFHLCRTSNPIEHYVDGNTIVRLDRDNYFFISGVPGHCNAGMKLEVILAGGSPSATPSASPTPGVSPPAATPTPTPTQAPPVPTPSPQTPPQAPPTVAPAPAVSTPVPSPSPVTAPVATPTSAPVPAPTTQTPSQSPLASSPSSGVPPTSQTPAEGPAAGVPEGNTASALSSSLATLIFAALLAGFYTI